MKIAILHKITALVLVFLLCLNNIKTLVTVTDFMYRQAEIAKNLCIQKDNQQECNGKCQLKIALADNNSDQSTPDIPKNNRFKLDVFHHVTNVNFAFQTTQTTDLTFVQCYGQNIIFHNSTLDVDTPPPKFFI